jgi:hypothetical protein
MAIGSEQECFHEDGFDDKWLGEVLVYTGLAWKIFHLFTNIFELTSRFRPSPHGFRAYTEDSENEANNIKIFLSF